MSAAEGPRIPPLPPDQWSDDVMAGIAALRPPGAQRELRRSKGGPKGLNVLGTFAQHPTLMRAYHAFNGHILYTTTLTPRHRELLVLRVAAVRSAEYEWEQHVVLGRDAGLTDDDIARIVEGPDAPDWSPFDAAMLRAVDELVDDARVTDANLGGARRRARSATAHGSRLHGRRLRPARHGLPLVRGRARRRPGAAVT